MLTELFIDIVQLIPNSVIELVNIAAIVVMTSSCAWHIGFLAAAALTRTAS